MKSNWLPLAAAAGAICLAGPVLALPKSAPTTGSKFVVDINYSKHGNGGTARGLLVPLLPYPRKDPSARGPASLSGKLGSARDAPARAHHMAVCRGAQAAGGEEAGGGPAYPKAPLMPAVP